MISPTPSDPARLIEPLDPLAYAVASRDRDAMQLARTALEKKQARLAFQPVVLSRDTSRVCFFEALIRVLDDGGRIIPAAQFMPQVEEHDIGRRIDAVTLELAFRMLRLNPQVRVSINVSARSLADSRWRRVLSDGLNGRGSLGDRLIFEISESSAMLLHEVVISFMEEMQPKGVCFALDGFGGGMTAFRHLKDFLFDFVKIDKSFAENVAEDPDNQVLIEALVMVAHQFEMFAVIDGVESSADADYLSRIGADCLQGYHFGAPRFDPV